MEDEQFIEIKKAIVALVAEMEKHQPSQFQWNMGAYKELKWVQYYPARYAAECALKRIGKLLTKSQRDRVLREMWNEGLALLWRR